MRYIVKSAGLLSLLLLVTYLGLAQESATISVIGSGIGNSLIETLAGQAEQESIDIRTRGTATGIDRFCNGDFDLATAIRPMSPAERAICGANDVVYSEFLLGHHVVAFVAHPDAPTSCLSATNLAAALKPSASNEVLDWSIFNSEITDLPLSLLVPQDNLVAHLIVDALVPGDGLRADITSYADVDAAIEQVAETAGALAAVPWSNALEDNPAIAVLELDADDSGACVSPSVESVEAERYVAALSIYLIVNRDRLNNNDSLAELLRFVTDSENAPIVLAAGVAPPSKAAYDLNENVLNDEAASSDAAGFQVPGELSGNVTIVGAANAVEVLDRVANSLTQTNVGLEINLDFAGQTKGLAALCAEEADIALLDSDLTAGNLDPCNEGEIATVPRKLGAQATVIIGNAADGFTSCLTTDQINTVWRAESAGIVTDWSGVDLSFPALGITLFGLAFLDQSTDILLQTAGDVIPPIRRDTEKDFSPLYRAAAVANVSGALTYMNWPEYQRVLESDQANIQLVAVDTGAGCVTPSLATIADGSYALSRPSTLLIRRESLSGINTQSYLWTLFDTDNWLNVEGKGFVGLSSLELPGLRLELLRWFAEAEAMYPPADDGAADDDIPGDETTDADSG